MIVTNQNIHKGVKGYSRTFGVDVRPGGYSTLLDEVIFYAKKNELVQILHDVTVFENFGLGNNSSNNVSLNLKEMEI